MYATVVHVNLTHAVFLKVMEASALLSFFLRIYLYEEPLLMGPSLCLSPGLTTTKPKTRNFLINQIHPVCWIGMEKVNRFDQ